MADSSSQPAWAKFMPAGEWKLFVAAVEDELNRRSMVYRLQDGYVWAPWGGEHDEALSLLNLAQLCHAGGPNRFAQLITGHFDALVAGRGDRVLADELALDLARARPLLKLRLYPRDTFAEQESEFIVREVADDLYAVLCFDLPSNVVTDNASALDTWKCTRDDVWFAALANLRRNDRPVPEIVELGGTTITTLTGDSFFVASNLLLLGDLITDEPEMGVLVAVPNRHTLVFHCIVDTSALQALQAMVVMANDLCAAGPGSISPNLFWWRAGELMTLPTTETSEHYEFTPPSAFIDEVIEPLNERLKMN